MRAPVIGKQESPRYAEREKEKEEGRGRERRTVTWESDRGWEERRGVGDR